VTAVEHKQIMIRSCCRTVTASDYFSQVCRDGAEVKFVGRLFQMR